MKEWAKYLWIFIIALIIGELDGYNHGIHKNQTIQPQKEPVQTVQGNLETKTETKIVYVPKNVDGSGVKEKTDVEANVGKPSVNVKINGHKAEIKKSDDERFVFDKNKIVLNQDSTITLEAKIDPVIIDKTKHWGIGIGCNSKNIAGVVLFPINRQRNIDGWVCADKEHKMGGVMFRF